jgi:hypothetical protein
VFLSLQHVCCEYYKQAMKYIYFDSSENEWKPATIEELAHIDDPSLQVCELDETGNIKQQTTYNHLKSE